MDPEAYFNKIYNGKRGLDPAVADLCNEMRIDTSLLMPKGIGDFREEGINERVAATRLEFFTKKRHQALAII